MLYMVIERFRNNDAAAVYSRFREKPLRCQASRTSSRCSAVSGVAGSSGFLASRRPRRGFWRRGRSGAGSGARLLSFAGTAAVDSGPGVKSGRPGTGPMLPGVTACSGGRCPSDDPEVGSCSDKVPPFWQEYTPVERVIM
jgi:hypothetical protein